VTKEGTESVVGKKEEGREGKRMVIVEGDLEIPSSLLFTSTATLL